jgi:hypothetical protein
MATITDVSPTTTDPCSTGRMLAADCVPDGSAVFAGTYANVWTSGDDGQTWDQLTWPQPPPDQYDVPGAIGGWSVVDVAVATGWKVDRDPRFLARFDPKGHVGIVGFGECGVWTALGNGDGTFQPPRVVFADFGMQAGGWRSDRHLRMVANLTGNGRADLIGFGEDGVWVALGNGDGTFGPIKHGIGNYGYDQHWRVDRHPRMLAHLTTSGYADIVGFGTDGVWVALGNGDGTFSEPHANPVLHNFGYQQHWRVDRHPRFVSKVTDSPGDDIVGFGTDGVWVALGNGDGTFSEPQPEPVLHDFGYAQGWRIDRHPRMLADIRGIGINDVVGFHDDGVSVALGNGNGKFSEPLHNPVLNNFATQQSWKVSEHPRVMANLTSSGRADIVGFGDAGVWTAVSDGRGHFGDATFALENFGVQQGWKVDQHERFVVDINDDGHADIVGFGDAGVWVALGDGHGGFGEAKFVLAAFGAGATALALTQYDHVGGSHGLWRSTDSGASWQQVNVFPATGEVLGQIEWAEGSDHLVYVAGGSALAISQDAGMTWNNVMPWGRGTGTAAHVAVWLDSPADPAPEVIYVLDPGTNTRPAAMYLSIDGGTYWVTDSGTLPANIGGATGSGGNANSPRVLVVSPTWPLEVIVAADVNSSPNPHAVQLYRGDYGPVIWGGQSAWDTLPLPALALLSGQDSGNVFLVRTARGRGDLLFYGSQRNPVWVGPIDPADASDWHALAAGPHADLHGIALAPDFKARLKDGNYEHKAGTLWLLSDGGIARSTDGGGSWTPGRNLKTLASVNVALASLPGKDPVLSLNTGDNDGLCSSDGGQHWVHQEYGGGDDDCSFVDPLRPTSMIVFTPRWNTAKKLNPEDGTPWDGHTVTLYEAQPGTLPDVSASAHAGHCVSGPQPLLPPPGKTDRPDRWNASSQYGNRGLRPIVRSLPGETAPDQGDYVFILDPTQSPQLVRTQNILDITDESEWTTTVRAAGQGANVFLQGPPLPTPVQPRVGDYGVVQASGGHANTVFFVRGSDNGQTSLLAWTQGQAAWTQLAPGGAAGGCLRFFVDPYRPNLIYLLDPTQVLRSDDGGATWQVDVALETQLTWNYTIQRPASGDLTGIGDGFDEILTDMQFDPNDPNTRFAVGAGGAFGTNDGGTTWTRFLHTGALNGRPANCIYDSISEPGAPALYVSFAGRSLVKITDLFPPVIF